MTRKRFSRKKIANKLFKFFSQKPDHFPDLESIKGMREIILRSDELCLSEYTPGYRVRRAERGEISGNPSAIILYHPTIGEILEEEKAIEQHGRSVLLAIVAEKYRKILLEAVFPDAVVLDAITDSSIPFIFNGKRKKKIRFTDNEKRTLSELPYGLTAKELAVRLGVSERSVRRTKSNLLRKTGLLSSGQLMVYALLSRRISNRSSSHTLDKV